MREFSGLERAGGVAGWVGPSLRRDPARAAGLWLAGRAFCCNAQRGLAPSSRSAGCLPRPGEAVPCSCASVPSGLFGEPDHDMSRQDGIVLHSA